jgi:hypothetical protein
MLTITNGQGIEVRRCELDKAEGLKRFVWNLNADPGITFDANDRVVQRPFTRPDSGASQQPAANGPTPQSCTATGGGRGGFGGGGRGGGPQIARVPNGIYRASISKMVGNTSTSLGPSQTFEVKALLAPQPF